MGGCVSAKDRATLNLQASCTAPVTRRRSELRRTSQRSRYIRSNPLLLGGAMHIMRLTEYHLEIKHCNVFFLIWLHWLRLFPTKQDAKSSTAPFLAVSFCCQIKYLRPVFGIEIIIPKHLAEEWPRILMTAAAVTHPWCPREAAQMLAVASAPQPLIAISTSCDRKRNDVFSELFHIQVAYGVSSLFYMFLKTQGVSPSTHPVKGELDRIR